MVRFIFIWAIALGLLAPVYAATLTRVYDMLHNPKQSALGLGMPRGASLNASRFIQKVDHFDKNSKAVFYQRYWISSANYRTGGPVILYNAGETNAQEYVNYVSQLEPGLLAERLGAVIIVIEHRYYGKSNPVPDLSSDNMIYLNLKNSLADLAYFITTVKIEVDGVDLPPPPKTPWIVMGASYGGALSAWVKHEYPNLVFAAIASSAPVEATYDFWEYFEPIRQGAPPHCSDSIINTIKYVDSVLFGLNAKKIQSLKARFGLPNVTHNDDFAAALITPLWNWQAIKPNGANPFKDFCKLFNKANTVPAQITAYASYMTSYVNKQECSDQDECFGTYNANLSVYTNTGLNNAARSWAWQNCYEFGDWQSAAPSGNLTLVSRLVTADYSERQCRLYFPDSILPAKPRVDYINTRFGGWNITSDHIFWINGQFDPWRDLTVNAPEAPKRVSTEESPDVVIRGGINGWDGYWKQNITKPIVQVHNKLITSLGDWLKNSSL